VCGGSAQEAIAREKGRARFGKAVRTKDNIQRKKEEKKVNRNKKKKKKKARVGISTGSWGKNTQEGLALWTKS